MVFERLNGKTIETASTRIEDGVQLNFDLRFTDGTAFTLTLNYVPKPHGRLFDSAAATGDLLQEWE